MALHESRADLSQLKKSRRRLRRALERPHQNRRLQMERLEERQLLAVGPQLIGIQPNSGSLLNDGDIRKVAPVDITFRFDENAQIDAATLGGIRLVRSGSDGLFGNGNDQVIQPGFIGVGEVPHEIVMRFSETLVDDVYQINIVGTGASALRNLNGSAFGDTTDDDVDNGSNFQLQFELDLGAQIIAVVPQPVERIGGQLQQRRNEIVVYFNDDRLLVEHDSAGNPTLRSADHPAFYQLILTRDTVRNTDDATFTPQSVTYDPIKNTATLRFSQPIDQLPDPQTGSPIGAGTFRLRIGTDETRPLAPQVVDVSALGTPGSSFDTSLSIGLDSVGMLVSGSASAITNGQSFTINRVGGGTRVFEFTTNPTTSIPGATRINYAGAATPGQLTALIVGAINGAGFNVQAKAVGTHVTLSNATSVVVSAGTNAVASHRLHSVELRGQITSTPYRNEWPGALDEPGHRSINVESHLLGGADTSPGIPIVAYNFQDIYGFDPSGNPLHNLITELQKQRAREIFTIYSKVMGVQFVETDALGLTIVTGDLRALDPEIPTGPGGVAGLAGGGVAIMDHAELWDDRFGANWFQTAMHEIGHLLGLGHSYELPELTIQGAESILNFDNRVEPNFPGDHDTVHGQHRFRPDGIDVDLYNFKLENTGVLSIESIAERLGDSSLLDTRLALYQVITDAQGNPLLDINGNPVRRLIAQNDDYYSKDSFLQLTLGPGTYYLGVSASGNDAYDPTIPDSGIGGTSEGRYQLRMTFGPDAARSIVDKPADMEVTGNGATIADGRTITVRDNTGATRTFEFDKSATPQLSNPNHIRIAITNQSTPTQIATALNTAINGSGLSLSATRVGTQIRLRENATVTLGAGLTSIRTDLPGTMFDGDHNGTPGGVYNFWFRAAAPAGQNLPGQPKTIFVDKSAPAGGDGSLARPLNNIAGTNPSTNSAFFGSRKANPGDIIRVVGNGGMDGNAATLADNLAYEVGFDALGRELPDGWTIAVPQGVTVMVDSGAIIKSRRAQLGVGSSTLGIDRSGGALQVLGTPSQSVYFTSYHDKQIGRNTDPFNTPAKSGDWGGLVFRTDVDRAQQWFNWEDQGVFLNYVNHADLRWGGGSIVVDSQPQVIDPIYMLEARPTISYNQITRSAASAISADPNSFEETNFHSPPYQLSGTFTSDYDRVGPDIYGNQLLNNSTNGLFIRVQTPDGSQLKPMTVSGRWDDTDIPHVLTENLRIEATPGGPIFGVAVPPVIRVTLEGQTGGTLAANGTYNYKIVYVDASGNESPPSEATRDVTLSGTQRSVLLEDLPTATAPFVARRIYRSDATGGGTYVLVAQIGPSTTQFIDTGVTAGGPLNAAPGLIRARLDARLSIDPGLIVKLEAARIETGVGSQFIAEAQDGREVIFTSRLDDRYGGSGTFDTNNDNSLGVQEAQARPGDWGGIYIGARGTGSIDWALFTYGGGVNKVEGNFAGFNVLEIHQGSARITNSIFERNAAGTGGQAPDTRFGRGFNDEGVVFVRNAEPLVLFGNNFRDNTRAGAPSDPEARAAAININTNGLYSELQTDFGRSTGFADLIGGYRDNQGPLIRENRFSNNELNGMKVRGETLTTQVVWDDTDIVHIVLDTIYVPDFHSFGGLRLESSPTESLVVKLFGSGAGFTATGRPLDINDRIGGILQVVGQPGSPVVFTSLRDDTAGAGFRTLGSPITDTNNDGGASSALPGDWRSLRIDQYAHDRNVEVVLEQEARDVDAPGPNAIPDRAQILGNLASHEKAGDDNQRLGFEVHGFLSASNDLDVYSFRASAGTEVWFDMDRTTHALDAIIELLDQNGQVIARSVNSQREQLQLDNLFRQTSTVQANILQKNPYVAKDYWGTNPRDPGMRVVLPGAAGVETEYFVRIRSNNPNVQTDILGGLTSGVYQLQMRLRETDEVPGSTVRYADIRYSTNAIEVFGQPIHSPLLGEASELSPGADQNDTIATALNLGNLLNADRGALAVSGRLATANDVDFYAFDVLYDSVQQTDIYTYLSAIFEIDYADGMARPNTRLAIFDENFRLVLMADDSNVADDQPRPLKGSDVADLTRGTAGVHDAYIGTQTMPQGRYYAAVSSTATLPTILEQFITANPADPMVRLEPVTSVRRVAEDHIDSSGGSTAQNPDLATLTRDNNFVPFHLGDVQLFVSQDGGRTPGHLTTFYQVNPFTGFVTNTMNQIDPSIGDIAMRYDGQLFAFSQRWADNRAVDDASVGNYLRIETGMDDITAQGYQLIGNDGIDTFEVDQGAEARADNPPTIRNGVGIFFNAMTFGGDFYNAGYAVGHRGEEVILGGNQLTAVGVSRTTNVLYSFNIDTGVGLSDPVIDRGGCGNPGGCRYVGAGTDIVERGQIITQETTITVPEATIYDPLTDTTTFVIQDGNRFTVTHPPIGFRTSTTFEFDSGPEVRMDINPAAGQVVRDGYYFSLDDFGPSPYGVHYQFDTGVTIGVPDFDGDGISGEHVVDGTTFRLFSQTGASVLFEFEDTTVNDGRQSPGSQLILYTPSMSQLALQTAIRTRINAIGAVGITATSVISGGEHLVALSGDTGATVSAGYAVNVNNPNSVLTGPSNVQIFNVAQRARTTIQMPNEVGLTLFVPASGGGGISDGDSFTLSDGPTTLVFEFDEAATPGGTGNVLIPYEAGFNAEQLRNAIVTAINGSVLNINAVKPTASSLAVHLGSTAGATLDTTGSPLTQTGNASGFSDGQTFSITTPKKTVIFEFDTDGVTRPGNLPLTFNVTQSGAVQADNLVNQAVAGLEASDARVGPVNIGSPDNIDPWNGFLQINRGILFESDFGEAPIYKVFTGGQFGDGEFFTVQTEGRQATFEFDVGDGVTAGRIPIPVDSTMTAVEVAQTIARTVELHTNASADAYGDEVVFNGLGIQVINLIDPTDANSGPSSRLELVPIFDNVDRGPDGLINPVEENWTKDQVGAAIVSSIAQGLAIEDVTDADVSPIQITVTDHGLTTGQAVWIEGVTAFGGTGDGSRANGAWTVTVVDADHFVLNNSTGAAFDYSGGGTLFINRPSADGHRVNFQGTNRADFRGSLDIFDVVASSAGGVSGTNIRLGFMAADSASQVADRIRDIITRELFPVVTAGGTGSTIVLENGQASGSPPLSFVSQGEGGDVTGIAIVQGTMYAVDNSGYLYRVNNHTVPGARSVSLGNVGGRGIPFSGLSAGPAHVEGGRYRNMLFGITEEGELYAFDTSGNLQPIFLDGQVSVATGIDNAHGLAFSNLDVNLWHTTESRRNDAGHGLTVPFDLSRYGEESAAGVQGFRDAGSSLWFGFENPAENGLTAVPDPRFRNTYNFPGGAHGQIESQTFSLAEASPNDIPVLYFNYFLATEGTNFVDENNRMRDSFRVFITDNTGVWRLLGTNNSFVGPEDFDDEFDIRPELVDEIYDNSGWRQARIDLSEFAGRSNLKLRFEFNTAGESFDGHPMTTGQQLRAVPGRALRDQDVFLVDGTHRFEFDLGYTLTTPAGASITSGETVTINDGLGVSRTFTFSTTPGPLRVLISPTMTAEQVATNLAQAIATSGLAVTPHRDGNRVNLQGGLDVVVTQSAGASVRREGAPGSQGGAAQLLRVHAGMDVTQVRNVIRTAMANQFAAGNVDVVKVYNDVVRLIGHFVLPADRGPLGVNNLDPTFLSGDLPRDEWGSFLSSGPPEVPGPYPTGYALPQRNTDNNHEGVYIDDLIIGFAERGEMVTNASANAGYRADPFAPDSTDIVVGDYQLEMRRGLDYLLNGEPPLIFRTFDTNARLAHQVTLVAPTAAQVYDGQTFEISDGLNKVVFEYNDVSRNNGVQPGRVPVPFNPVAPAGPSNPASFTAESAARMAAAIRDAINSPAAQAVLKITAGLADGVVTGGSSRNPWVNLYGNATGDAAASLPGTHPTFSFGGIEHISWGHEAGFTEHVWEGDSNLVRDQGQILIHSNLISNAAQFGIVSDAGNRNRDDLVPLAGDLPHSGPTRNLQETNPQRWVPGVVIENNIVYGSGTGGIRFGGDSNAAGQPRSSIPYGRITNNTIYGHGVDDVGIDIGQWASPTVLNNIVANYSTGIRVDATSTSTVLGGSVFQGNGTNTVGTGPGAFSLLLSPEDPLFVDPANQNFYLAHGSLAIDSSIDSLEDRPDLVTVRNPLGIGLSPIKAPEMDITGQLRVDDETAATPGGQGSNVFIDRGALDRSDFVGPTAVLLVPRDNDSDGNDLDSTNTVVRLAGTTVISAFSIQIIDGVPPADPAEGIGVDDLTVTTDAIVIRRNGTVLVDGIDYTFNYNETTNTIRLTPIAGIWPKDSIYTIELANQPTDGIMDLAGNGLKPNRSSGDTAYTIVLGNVPLDFGDAPDATLDPDLHYPTRLLDEGAHHLVLESNPLYLGTGVDAELDGAPTLAANGDNLAGDPDEDGVVFGTPFNPFINTPVTVTASGDGFLDAWIDWDGDGQWDASEKILDSVSVVAGENTFFVTTPANAATGLSYARFRLSARGGLEPIGLAESGEVEDYRVEILPGNPPVANNDPVGGLSWSTNEDTVLVVSDSVLDNDTDDEPLTVFNAGVPMTSTLGARVVLNADGTFTYDPRLAPDIQKLLAGGSTTDTFLYRAFDGVLASSPATVTITVTGLNDTPLAPGHVFSATEDGTVLTTGFGGVDPDEGQTATLTYALVPGSVPAEGTVVNNGNGTFSFDPLANIDFQDLALNEVREVYFQYRATDVVGTTSPAGEITIQVTGVNDAPVANHQTALVFEDGGPRTFAFAGTDVDSDDSDPAGLHYEIFGSPTAGILTNNGDGTFTYNPGSAFQALSVGDTAQMLFLYRATDRHGALSGFGTLTLAVQGVNDAPTASNDPPAPNVYATNEDTPLTITNPAGGLLANDTDVDANDVLTIQGAPRTVSSSRGASVQLNANGTFTYDPRNALEVQALNVGETMTDTFVYQVTDGQGGIASATATLTISGLNDRPLADAPAPLVISAQEDGGNVTGTLPGDDWDSEDTPDTVRYALIPGTGPSEGTVTLTGRTVTFNPGNGFRNLRPGEIGTVTFQYRVIDSRGAVSDPGTVTIEVVGNNDAPFATNDTAVNEINSSVVISVLANDTDPDDSPADPASVIVVTQPAHGTAVANANGTITYTATPGYRGPDSFSYRYRDAEGSNSLQSNIGTVIVTTTNFPVAGSRSVSTFVDTPVTINAASISSDADGTVVPSSVVIVGGPSNGTATVDGTGRIVYTPAIGYEGGDSIQYTIQDNAGATSAPGTITISVSDNPTLFRNPRNRFDVNDDGRVNSYDVLLVISYINRFGPGQPSGSVPPYLDVAPADNFISVQDVRAIIEFLISGGSGEGEGESSSSGSSLAIDYHDVEGRSADVSSSPIATGSLRSANSAEGEAIVQADSEETAAPPAAAFELADSDEDELEDLLASDIAGARAASGSDLVDQALLALLYDQPSSNKRRR